MPETENGRIGVRGHLGLLITPLAENIKKKECSLVSVR
jgi:hypothetical protein